VPQRSRAGQTEGEPFDSPTQTVYDLHDAVSKRLPSTGSLRGKVAGMMWWRSLVAVAVGGMLGCLLRWVLAIFLNRLFPTIPPGTLAANLIGCYIIGIAIAFFVQNPHFAPEWRLFVTTGFCGGLTTFSTFSAEVVMLMQSGRNGSALMAIGTHLIGSLLMTFAGVATVGWLSKA
jgi:CrcB protein